MGFDLGSKTLGIAVSDPLGMFAHPHSTLFFPTNKHELVFDELKTLVEEIKPEIFVLGLPRLLNNDLGPRAQISLDFKELLETWFSREVILLDERFSTASSQRALIKMDVSRKKRKKVIDQAAAVEILQRYLDQRRYENESRNNGRNPNDY